MKDIREFTDNDMYNAQRLIFKSLPNHKDEQRDYWVNRVYNRLEYLSPLIVELNLENYDLLTVSKPLYIEYTFLVELIKLHNNR
jgi:hypothetical protein